MGDPMEKIIHEEFGLVQTRILAIIERNAEYGNESDHGSMKLQFKKMDISMQTDKELRLAKERILIRIKNADNNGNQSLPQRSMKLEFRNKIKETVLTGAEIKGEGDVFIQVALIDESTGNIVDVGPEAYSEVEIFVLKGTCKGDDEWTAEEFNENIVQEIKGKKPFLEGNVTLTLEKGIAVMDNLQFKHHTIKIRPSLFRLGARIVGLFGGARVKEAKTERFTVKDFRKRYYMKKETPHLSDDVGRLVNIWKGGKIWRSLHGAKINNVEQFLIRLLRDPVGLKNIIGEKNWEATVNNAQKCRAEKRLFCYIEDSDQAKKRAIVFNILGEVQTLYAQNHQYPADILLSENLKADCDELLQYAFEHWEDTKSFDDEISLQAHLSIVMLSSTDQEIGIEDFDVDGEHTKSFDEQHHAKELRRILQQHTDPPQLSEPDYSSCYEDATPKRMVLGESSSGRSNSLFRNATSGFDSSTDQESDREYSRMEISDYYAASDDGAPSYSYAEAFFPDFFDSLDLEWEKLVNSELPLPKWS